MASTRQPVLVLGGTGKVGRRVVERLTAADGVQRALGREPRDFRDYACEAAASGVWNASAVAA